MKVLDCALDLSMIHEVRGFSGFVRKKMHIDLQEVQGMFERAQRTVKLDFLRSQTSRYF